MDSTISRTSSGRRTRRDWAGPAERFSEAFGLVFLLLVASFMVASLSSFAGWSAVAIAALGSATSVIGIASSGVSRRVVRWAAALGGVSLILSIVSQLTDTSAFLAIAAVLQVFLLTWMAGAVLRSVVNKTEVVFRTILGAISVYLTIGLLFSFLYVAVDRLQTGHFFGAGPVERGDFIFFSITTLTTTGYGNLVPVSQPGRMFAALEMLVGQLFVVTLIAGLVSLWKPRRRGVDSDDRP
jgi:hypothetical protein